MNVVAGPIVGQTRGLTATTSDIGHAEEAKKALEEAIGGIVKINVEISKIITPPSAVAQYQNGHIVAQGSNVNELTKKLNEEYTRTPNEQAKERGRYVYSNGSDASNTSLELAEEFSRGSLEISTQDGRESYVVHLVILEKMEQVIPRDGETEEETQARAYAAEAAFQAKFGQLYDIANSGTRGASLLNK
ncbi:MAG: hypothetical protein COV36_04230 [Alphaproteobacteria bacterium CG11_big_fil_rev_8_21_14_0_20_44_7]|nr:MAG: hypothetical protein COV36_04230 [Alphaproteobacteria bacterium CG11_big_fil_rev_8_21_14_0_20_44_7]